MEQSVWEPPPAEQALERVTQVHQSLIYPSAEEELTAKVAVIDMMDTPHGADHLQHPPASRHHSEGNESVETPLI